MRRGTYNHGEYDDKCDNVDQGREEDLARATEYTQGNAKEGGFCLAWSHVLIA